MRLIGFITEPATVRQILAHAGEPTTALALAPARSPPVEANAQQLIAPEAVEAIPELEFDQTANPTAEAGDYQWTSPVDADAEPVPELECDQTSDWKSCSEEWNTRPSISRRGPAARRAHCMFRTADAGL